MGERHLLDSNTIIDYIGELIPEKSVFILDRLLDEALNVSVVSRIEVLGYNGKTSDMRKLDGFLAMANILYVDQDIADKTISIRKKHKIKLPDAIIAATALVFDFILISRNLSDFKKITGLSVLNPYDL
ncbi:type II toxin-antitoxin system VapC family toxin [Parapedobacter tibetensis]|uniref:type II toxin-antitoxin system VapC family toxin n=1 Tax=Parapedobacter tibetensis TaxID=2972951 RepID=UPI00214D713F|nr:type II toxin-antitoxin system VapC family toxin [Parapedobacter tibetensis]